MRLPYITQYLGVDYYKGVLSIRAKLSVLAFVSCLQRTACHQQYISWQQHHEMLPMLGCLFVKPSYWNIGLQRVKRRLLTLNMFNIYKGLQSENIVMRGP